MGNVIHVPIPEELIQDALAAHHIQQKWSLSSIEHRCRDAERRAYHFHDILMQIIIKEMIAQKHIPYNPK